MTMPVIPDREREDIINDLLESIALEETALAHLINAEAEKIQWAVGTLENQERTENDGLTFEEVLAIQDAVVRVMRSAIKFQMLLQFKLEDVLDLIDDNNNNDNNNDNNNNGHC